MDWRDVGIEIKTGWKGNVKVHCPKCKDTRKNKGDKSLSVNIDEKIWNCHHCSWTGKLVGKKHKEYIRPKQAELNLSENTISYLRNRGFGTYTIQRFKIGETTEFMASKGKEMNCINFPYFRKGELINVKYRSGSKDFKMVAGAELILFNLDSLESASECVITEGEFDCMAAFESGYQEAVSVPNGASRGNQKMEYLDNCYEFFEGIKKVVIAADGDEPGTALKMELARRLGRHRCWYVEYPEDTKDLNEVLIKYGKESVKQVISDAKPFPVDGVFRVEDIEPELDFYYDNGFQGGDLIGSMEFDKIFSFRRGELTTITGIPGSGKSAKLDDWLVRLSGRKGWKHAVCSPENQPVSIHISKLASCFIGKPFYRANRDQRMSKMEWDFAKCFINDYFLFYNITEVDMTVDGILDKAAELVTRYGIDSLVIDPWNTLDHTLPPGMTETQFISKSLTKITNFAKSYGVHVFMVAHPTKLQKDKATGKFEIPNLYSISGSAHFFNKTDNGITVYRDYDTNLITVYVQKVRFFFVGKIGFVSYTYELDTGRYAEEGSTYEKEFLYYMRRMGITDDFLDEPKPKQQQIINYYEPKKSEDDEPF